jgi:hypothetical protein
VEPTEETVRQKQLESQQVAEPDESGGVSEVEDSGDGLVKSDMAEDDELKAEPKASCWRKLGRVICTSKLAGRSPGLKILQTKSPNVAEALSSQQDARMDWQEEWTLERQGSSMN